MMRNKRMKSICAVCKQVFEIGDNDKVFFDFNGTTRTVCLKCQNKIRNMEVCEICGEPRNKKSIKTIRLVGYAKFRCICIWCLKRMRKNGVQK